MSERKESVRLIEASTDNARRIAELTREAYARKEYNGAPIYSPEVLDTIINPLDDVSVEIIRSRLADPGTQPNYYGLFAIDLETGEEQLQGHLKVGTWDKGDQKPFSRGLRKLYNPGEYFSQDNRVFGLHTLAVSDTFTALGGIQLFRRMTRDYSDSTMKTAVDVRDEQLCEYVEKAWRMTDTGIAAPSPVGDLGKPDWPEHRLFSAHVGPDGRVT